MTETTSFNIGDITATIVLLGFTIFIVAIVIFIIRKLIKQSDKSSVERLSIERENTLLLQKRIDDLNDRVMIIEKMLREVE